MYCCVLLCIVVLCIVVLCTVVLRIVVSCLNSLILETINIMTSKIHNTTINYLDFNQRRDQFFFTISGEYLVGDFDVSFGICTFDGWIMIGFLLSGWIG